ncbi:MAG: hypothetical protein AAGU23_05810 [Bacillota bacterium]|nr:hypothetical protein [Bacillota bacterium]
MRKMAEAEIKGIAETIAPQTSERFTTVVFQDGTIEAVEGSWLGYRNVWVIVQGKAEAGELYAQLLQSYNEIQYCQGW